MSYILLMGLDEPLQHALEQLFRSERYEFIAVEDGNEGRVRIMNRDPGLIIMSEDMPRINDETVLEVVRRFTAAPIVVIGRGGENTVVKALLDGADVYLKRPVNHRELLSRARVLIRRTSNG